GGGCRPPALARRGGLAPPARAPPAGTRGSPAPPPLTPPRSRSPPGQESRVKSRSPPPPKLGSSRPVRGSVGTKLCWCRGGCQRRRRRGRGAPRGRNPKGERHQRRSGHLGGRHAEHDGRQ